MKESNKTEIQLRPVKFSNLQVFFLNVKSHIEKHGVKYPLDISIGLDSSYDIEISKEVLEDIIMITNHQWADGCVTYYYNMDNKTQISFETSQLTGNHQSQYVPSWSTQV